MCAGTSWRRCAMTCIQMRISVSKETFQYGKRGLFTWQKRPSYMAKEFDRDLPI